MANAPDTWTVLKSVQALLQNNLLVGGVSPMTAFSVADVAKYGVGNAYYLGFPKDLNVDYPRQCHIIPPQDETVYRRAFGGKIWDEGVVYVRFAFDYTRDSYQTIQDLVKARDAMHVLMSQHAEMPGAPTVEATKEAGRGSSPTGFHFTELFGFDWACWGFLWWVKQQWGVPGGIIP